MRQQTTQKSLVWLASYPKSGNTWLRAFLGNYLFEADGPLPLDALKRISSGDSSLPHYQQIAGGRYTMLTAPQRAQVRARVLHGIAGQAPVNLVKTHSLNAKQSGLPLIPPEITKAALYVIRDPLDMLVSYMDHLKQTPEQAAESIADPENHVPTNASTVKQLLGSWSAHVDGWTRAKAFKVETLRYEDMRADPEATFSRALKAIGAPVDKAQLLRAIDHASFETLSAMEAQNGFSERAAHQDRFFRKGGSGHGKTALPQAVIDKVIKDHGRTMRHFGYL